MFVIRGQELLEDAEEREGKVEAKIASRDKLARF